MTRAAGFGWGLLWLTQRNHNQIPSKSTGSQHSILNMNHINRCLYFLFFVLINTLIKIYSFSGLRDKIKAESLLVVGVKLAEMTETQGDEWWMLPPKTKRMIEARRNAWEKAHQFVPIVTKCKKALPRKRKSRTKTWTALPPSSVTQVHPFFHKAFLSNE